MNRLRRLAGLLRRLRPRHLLALPPLALYLAARALQPASPRWPRAALVVPALDWGRGISVVIPERGGGDLLAACLAHLAVARAALDEPSEVIVVVNGSPAADYAALQAAYPDLNWQFHRRPLGFSRAVRHGVAVARFGAVYLLNNDMLLAPEALSRLLPQRTPAVFALASQIHMPGHRRREETGWTRFRHEDGVPAPWHAVPPDDRIRGTVWAGAGAGLFQRALLRQLLPAALDYDPFYWEDVDLGLRAWQRGYESRLVPGSLVEHGHRVTVRRYYPEHDVARVFERNRLQLLLRHVDLDCARLALMRRLLAAELHSLAELCAPRRLLGQWRCLRGARRLPASCTSTTSMASATLSPRPRDGQRRQVVLVSPFAMLPAQHGGAVRSLELARALAADVDVLLLSDEAEAYPDTSPWIDAPFREIHLVDRRPPGIGSDRIARMRQHAHGALAIALQRLIETRQPDCVLVAHSELALLAGVPTRHRPRWLLDLHDVLLCPDDPREAAADAFERAAMAAFDAVLVCSQEDRELLGESRAWLVPNGVDAGLATRYTPSAGCRDLLFVGPFRAPNNLDGIAAFVARVYPALRRAVPGVGLTLVGGPGAAARIAGLPGFAAPGIRVLETVADMPALLREHVLCLNPQAVLRGSSLKVIEALAAGRVCLSTAAGARGWHQAGLAGLVVVDGVDDFLAPLLALLQDAPARLARERPEATLIARCSWEHAGQHLRGLLAGLLAGHATAAADDDSRR